MAAPTGEEEHRKHISLRPIFNMMDHVLELEARARADRERKQGMMKTAIGRHMGAYVSSDECKLNGIKRIQLCRNALDALDRRGWDRSFHQRMFHEEYLKSCARIFFKRDGPGAFAINHNRVLELNGWDSTPQEILVSTPRRFGKTISVSMFAAAIIFAAPNMELSIYSTCKRISQKLLRNIVKFLDLIYLELGVPPYKIIRMNSEARPPLALFFCFFFCILRKQGQEVHIGGPEGHADLRVVNSYPSKIGTTAASRNTRPKWQGLALRCPRIA